MIEYNVMFYMSGAYFNEIICADNNEDIERKILMMMECRICVSGSRIINTEHIQYITYEVAKG